MGLEDDVLAGLAPDEDERSRVDSARASLESAATQALQEAGVDGVAQVQGSIAKDTWIAGAADMDCFLVLPMDTPEDSFESLVSGVASKVLSDPKKKYAQHPYIIGERDGFQVDLVPAYRIESSQQRLSAVDRTPLHTQWVTDHLSEDARDQVRLLKQWCKGIGVYGAETRIGGFSGYLLEVLIHHFGGFLGVLQWAAAGEKDRIAMGDDQVKDDVSPLIVVDPVDATRNCAAAVTQESWLLFQEAARAYTDRPDARFFHPAPPSKETGATLSDHLDQDDAMWIGVVLQPQTDRLDLVFPQFQRAARVAAESLERAGFPVRRHRVDAWADDTAIGMQWVTDRVELPAERTHRGPPADKEPNAGRFRDKWTGHPDTSNDVAVGDDGRLEVTLQVHDRTPGEWLQSHLATALTGKHVQKALTKGCRVLNDPSLAPDDWAPTVADHVLDRRPWQRQAD